MGSQLRICLVRCPLKSPLPVIVACPVAAFCGIPMVRIVVAAPLSALALAVWAVATTSTHLMRVIVVVFVGGALGESGRMPGICFIGATMSSEFFAVPHLNRKEIGRFFGRIVRSPSGCWEWRGDHDSSGYGRTYYRGTQTATHRIMAAWVFGPIPTGFEKNIDHLCRNRICCNPSHLELVDWGENVRRGFAAGRAHPNRNKTHCPKGHSYSGANLYTRPADPNHRICRQCVRERPPQRRKLKETP